MKYTTVMIQLSPDSGIEIDYPDDWEETIDNIAQMVYTKYKCGLDIVFGLASRKLMEELIIETDTNKGSE
tara:strand:+ start:2636 stop:2845 length:210 start_codon:yes stop_codon:yes gene_type:complete